MNKPVMIFVFGSNLAGRHGKGAALYARQNHGAEYGVGEGRTGDSYAIPTKDEKIRTRPLEQIKASVESFLLYASENPHLVFQVTRVGCGLAGYTDSQIAPMFRGVTPNCEIPEEWNEYL